MSDSFPITTIEIPENDDAEVIVFLKLPETFEPYDLTDADLTFIAKATRDTADADAFATYAISPEMPETDGKFIVSFVRADVATPGQYWYKVRKTKNSKTITVQAGPLIVKNT